MLRGACCPSGRFAVFRRTGAHRRCWPSRSDLGLRCSSLLGATPSSARRLKLPSRIINDELSKRASCYSTSASTLCFRHLNGVSLAGLGERWPSRLVATAEEDRLSTRPRSFLPRFSVAARGYVL